MSKVLELAVYERNDDGDYLNPPAPDGRQYVIAQEDVDVYCMTKALTDAELAAEVFRQAAWIGANGRAHKTDEGRNIVFEAAFTFGPITRDEHQYLTVHRFASLPHYDEQDQA